MEILGTYYRKAPIHEALDVKTLRRAILFLGLLALSLSRTRIPPSNRPPRPVIMMLHQLPYLGLRRSVQFEALGIRCWKPIRQVRKFLKYDGGLNYYPSPFEVFLMYRVPQVHKQSVTKIIVVVIVLRK